MPSLADRAEALRASLPPRRREMLKKLTAGLATPGFSYLRLGDMEMHFMLRVQASNLEKDGFIFFDRDKLGPSIKTFVSGAALAPEHYSRLRHSYEQCSFLDLYQFVPECEKHQNELIWNLGPEQIRTSDAQDSHLLYDWFSTEFFHFAQEHRVLICGAESALLKELLAFPEYGNLARHLIPMNAQLSLIQPLNNGRTLAKDLEAIKEQIKLEIARHRPETVFLCLAGYSKILGHELAREMGVSTFDAGSILRALTYSGSSGSATWRANHNPFFFRVPLPLYMRALQQAHPELTSEEQLAKALAQLCLDLMKKEAGRSFPADRLDPKSLSLTEDNLKWFWEDFAYYKKNIRPLAGDSPKGRELLAEFDQWRMYAGIGVLGKLYQATTRWDSKLEGLRAYRSLKRTLGGGSKLRSLLLRGRI